MKIRNILYISAIMLLAGCSKDADISSNTLSGNGEKTPLLINATLNTGRAGTRAEGKTFEKDDQLLAYIRHTTDGTKGNYTYITDLDPDYANQLVTISKSSVAAMTVVNDSVNSTTDLSPVYWDDFSNSDDPSTDLRTTYPSLHGLQSYYGYCYNGGTPDAESFTKSSGVLTWTVKQDQRSIDSYKHSDILWSPEQATVAYNHDTNPNFTIPFTHAMSQITVVLTASSSAGFSGNPLISTELVLNNMHTKTTLTAPTGTWTDIPGYDDVNVKAVKMYGGTNALGLIRTYSAIVAPGTKLKEGVLLLNINNADGNYYKVDITNAMLQTDAWARAHPAGQHGNDEGGDGKAWVITQPGYNYRLNVTIQKSAIAAHATLTDWSTVTASGTGDIQFDDGTIPVMDDSWSGGPDVGVVTIDRNKFVNGSKFNLYRLQSTSSNTGDSKDYTTRPNTAYQFDAVSKFQNNSDGDDTAEVDDEWTNTPRIYWPGSYFKYYYRALAIYKGVVDTKSNIDSIGNRWLETKDYGTSVSQGLSDENTATGGNDILWGTSAVHKGSTSGTLYQLGEAIPPRTGGVPIVFEHALSKISFNLTTSTDAASQVDLENATITISGIYKDATIRIDNGSMDYSGKSRGSFATKSITDFIVIPQPFDDDNAKVTITLNDGQTTYNIPLRNCVDNSATPVAINKWEGGKTYTYTINVTKEAVQFHAYVKDWGNVTGSGTATLDW